MRREIEGRPLVVAAAGLIAAISCLYALENFVLLIFLFAWLSGPEPGKRVSRAQTAYLVGAFLAVLRPPIERAEPIRAPHPFAGEVRLLSMPRIGQARQVALVETARGRLTLSLPNWMEASLGDRFRVSGRLVPFSESTEDRWTREGAAGEIRPIVSDRISQGPWLFRIGSTMRRSFVGFADGSLPPEAAAFVTAVCFNQDQDLPPQTVEALRNTGTIHLVSTSGLHAMLLAWMAGLLLERLLVPRRIRMAALMLLLFVYSAAAGFRPPTVRAATMGAMYCSASFWNRVPDVLSAIAFAAIAILVLGGTEKVLDPGFQISFVTATALVLAFSAPPPWPSQLGPRVLRIAGEALRVSIVAWLASAPLIAYHFGQVSLVAVVANYLIVFVAPIVIGLGLAAWGLAGMVQALGTILLWPVKIVSGYALAIVEALGALPLAAVPLPPFSAYWLVLLYGAGLMMWRPRARPSI